MPKPFSTAYHNLLLAGTPAATCLVITLRDSSVLPLSTWSDFFTYTGLSFDPTLLVKIEDVSASIGTGVITLTVTGLIGVFCAALGRTLTKDDVRFLFEGATASIFDVFPSTLSAGQETLATGELGQIQLLNDTAFTFEFRSLAQRSRIQSGQFITQNCHKEFGVQNFNGTGCPVDLSTLTYTVPVVSVSADGLTMTFTVTPSRGFTRGTIVGAAGSNSFVPPKQIKSHTQAGSVATIVLFDSLPYQVSVGDSMSLVEGCTRDLAACIFFTGTGAPFGGAPDIPGVDRLTTAGNA